ncbi:MAG: antibiotic biosynthesis monooxygenase family protein [Vicinamibacteria bacterium]
MIARSWTAEAIPEQAEEYILHFRTKVLPVIASIEGHRGAYVLKRRRDEVVELVVITLWESMDAVRNFAGDDPDVAVVTREARAILSRYDEHVAHYEVAWRPHSSQF